MPLYGSKLFKNFFGTEEMRLVFSDETRVARFLRTAVALAKVEADMGLIPSQAYEEISRRAFGLTVNWERLRQDIEAFGYPVLPSLDQLGDACGSAAEYLHWGAATREIADIAFTLQLRDALSILETESHRVCKQLRCMTEAYQSTVMLSRTDGMPALPITFGVRCAMWRVELERQAVRMASLRTGLMAGGFGGTSSAVAMLGERAEQVQAALTRELGLKAPSDPWVSSRDQIGEIVYVVAAVASAMAAMAGTIAAMSASAVQELRESSPGGRCNVGAAPHAGCDRVIFQARLATQNVTIVMDAVSQNHQRDWLGHLDSLVVPQTFLLVHSALTQMANILDGLEVFPQRMRRNIDLAEGLAMADNVVSRLARKSGRRTAHRLVSRVCESAVREDQSLRDALMRSREVTALMTAAEIDAALDPAACLASGPQRVEQATSHPLAWQVATP
ncbi:hypothetical protein GN316_03205 [Xylophilus sp. Kf1]|nr:hypothetical protein [Xylophilus sp. Kf1]